MEYDLLGGINLKTYKCDSCGYKAEVLETPETETYYTIETKHCLGCKSLVPVATKAHSASMIGGDEGGFGPDYKYVNECPECCSKNVQDWDVEHSCPKCGEHMVLDGAQV